MANTPTEIKNVSLTDLVLPTPYYGVLQPNGRAIVADSVTGAQGALGGFNNIQRIFQLVSKPTGTALTIHGAANVSETLAVPTATVSVAVNVSRFDPVTAGAVVLATLPNGLYIGQTKRLYQMSATGATGAVITPTTMAESKTLVSLKCLGAWADLNWQSAGWTVTGIGGPTGPCAVIQ